MPWALVLSDGKPGHENQSLGILPKGVEGRVLRIAYRSKPARLRAWLAARFPAVSGLLMGRFPWGGIITDSDRLNDCLAEPPVVVLSSGSGPAPMTLHIAHHFKTPAITCMTPSVGLSHFDLALVPRHDNPPAEANIVTTLGAPNRVEPARLAVEGEAFKQHHNLTGKGYICLLLGGDSAHHAIPPETGVAILNACVELAETHGFDLLVTTSRRTREETETAMYRLHDQCAYFCRGRIDSEPVMQGMLALADLVLVTEDSVSMVSEAASCPARVVALRVPIAGNRPPRRHEAVLSALADGGYAARADVPELGSVATALLSAPAPPMLDDTTRCRAAVSQLLDTAS